MKISQNATLSIPPRKNKVFYCFNRHYFSSHDQHVWSWTHDHTPANLMISYPGMIWMIECSKCANLLSNIMGKNSIYTKLVPIFEYRVKIHQWNEPLLVPFPLLLDIPISANLLSTSVFGWWLRPPTIYEETGAAACNIHCYTVIGFW